MFEFLDWTATLIYIICAIYYILFVSSYVIIDNVVSLDYCYTIQSSITYSTT